MFKLPCSSPRPFTLHFECFIHWDLCIVLLEQMAVFLILNAVPYELPLHERHRTCGCSALPHCLLSSAFELALSKSMSTDVGGATWGKRVTT